VRHEETLARLLAEIDQRAREKVLQIKADEQKAIKRIEAEARAALDSERARREEKFRHDLESRQKKALRRVEETRLARIWAFERNKMRELELAIRRRLEAQPFDAGRFRIWLESARKKIGRSEGLVLEVRKDWRRSAQKYGMKVKETPILGGGILTDPEGGRQVDGSWDRRLADLWPGIWQRWKNDVGQNR